MGVLKVPSLTPGYITELIERVIGTTVPLNYKGDFTTSVSLIVGLQYVDSCAVSDMTVNSSKNYKAGS